MCVTEQLTFCCCFFSSYIHIFPSVIHFSPWKRLFFLFWNMEIPRRQDYFFFLFIITRKAKHNNDVCGKKTGSLYVMEGRRCLIFLLRRILETTCRARVIVERPMTATSPWRNWKDLAMSDLIILLLYTHNTHFSFGVVMAAGFTPLPKGNRVGRHLGKSFTFAIPQMSHSRLWCRIYTYLRII